MKKLVGKFLTLGLSIAMLFGLISLSPAQGPTAVDVAAAESTYTGTYYNGITATSGNALLGQLHNLISSTHKTYLSYSGLNNIFPKSDPGLDGKGFVEFYTHETITTGFGSSPGVGNKEHVWAQSLSKQSNGNKLWEKTGAGADLLHIRPTEYTTNNTRGSDKYGEVTGGTAVNSKAGHLAGYHTGGVFEPNDNVKGDVARIVMYVYTHYNTYSNSSVFGSYATTNGSGSSSYFGQLTFTQIMSASNESAAIKLLLEWNELDQVDNIEKTRNEVAFDEQGNRNPFIDHPEYASAIWGDGSYTPNPDSGSGSGSSGSGTGSQTTEAFTAITSPQNGTYYMGMNVENTMYYITGEKARDYYLGTSTTPTEAGKVTLTQSGSGWTLKVGSKYIEAVRSADDQHVNADFTTTSSGTWTWDTEKKIFTWTITEGNQAGTYYLGNYWASNNKTPYTSISASKISNYGNTKQYYAQLGTLGTQGGGGGTDPGTNPGGGGGTVTPTPGETETIKITTDSFKSLSSTYDFFDWTADGISGYAFIYGDVKSTGKTMQFNKKKDSYYLANTTELPGVLKSVKITATTSQSWKLLTSSTAYGQVKGAPSGTGTIESPENGVITWTVTDPNAKYFALVVDGSGASKLSSIEITYSTGSQTVDPDPDVPDVPDPDVPDTNMKALEDALKQFDNQGSWNFAIKRTETYDGETYEDYYEYLGYKVLNNYVSAYLDENGDEQEGEFTDYLAYDAASGKYFFYYDCGDGTYEVLVEDTDSEFEEAFSNLYLVDFVELKKVEFTYANGKYTAKNAATAGNNVLGVYSYYEGEDEEQLVTLDWATFEVYLGSDGRISKIHATLEDDTVIEYIFSKYGTVNFTLPEVGGTDPVDPTPPALTGITVSPATLALTVGGTKNTSAFTVTAQPADAVLGTVTFTTTDTNIIKIENGVITALAAGKATITVSAGSVTATVSVTVTEPDTTAQDTEKVDAALATLQDQTIQGTTDLHTQESGVTLTWTTSTRLPAGITVESDKIIVTTRPENDLEIVFTVTATLNKVTKTKEVTYTVKAAEKTDPVDPDNPPDTTEQDRAAVNAVLGKLTDKTIEGDTTLQTASDGVTLTWTTSTQLPEGIKVEGGKITVTARPATDLAIVFTVKATLNGVEETKTVTITVKAADPVVEPDDPDEPVEPDPDDPDTPDPDKPDDPVTPDPDKPDDPVTPDPDKPGEDEPVTPDPDKPGDSGDTPSTPGDEPTGGETPSQPVEEKKGCGGVIGGAVFAIAAILLAAAVVIVAVEKKRQ